MPQLIGEAQPVRRAATRSDLGLVGRRKPDTVGTECTVLGHCIEPGRVLLQTVCHGKSNNSGFACLVTSFSLQRSEVAA